MLQVTRQRTAPPANAASVRFDPLSDDRCNRWIGHATARLSVARIDGRTDTWSHTVNSHISTQNRASVLLLLELLFVREGVLSCPICRRTILICLLILYAFLDANKS